MSDQVFSSPSHIREQALRSSKWVLLSNLIPAVLNPLLVIILASLLTPADFGVVAIASLAIALLTMLQQFGLGPALIQNEEHVEAIGSVAFWLSLAMGGMMYVLIWICAPFIAAFYSEPRVTAVLRILGFNLVFSSFAVVPTALLQRHFQNKSLFWMQLSGSVVPFAVSIPMALMGVGYWALVGGTLTGNFIRSLSLWYQSRWLPTLNFDLRHVYKLLSFSAFVVFEQFLGWLLIYLDKAIIGKQLGPEALGIYSVAFSISIMVISLPLTAVTGLALPAFSRLQHDMPALRSAYLNGTRLVASYSIPAAFGLALVADLLTGVLFGNKWAGLGSVLAIMAIYNGLGSLWTLSSDAFKSLGRPDIMPKLYISAVCYMVPIFLISVPHGLITFSICRTSVVPVFAIPHILLASKYLGLSKSYLWDIAWRPLVCTIPMICISFSAIVFFGDLPDIITLCISILAAALTYFLSFRIIDKPFTDSLIENLKYLKGC